MLNSLRCSLGFHDYQVTDEPKFRIAIHGGLGTRYTYPIPVVRCSRCKRKEVDFDNIQSMSYDDPESMKTLSALTNIIMKGTTNE